MPLAHGAWSLDPRRTALIVTDVQNDYTHPKGRMGRHLGAKISRMRRILKPLRGLIARCKKRGARVVWIRSVRKAGDNEKEGHRIRPPWVFFREKTDWMGGPAEGSWGAEFAPEVMPGPRDIVVRKRRHSAFYKSDLERVLRGLKVDTLLFAGIATYACVEASLRDAFFRDFDVVLVADCCAASNLPMHKATLRLVRNLYGAVAPSKTIAAKLRRTRSR